MATSFLLNLLPLSFLTDDDCAFLARRIVPVVGGRGLALPNFLNRSTERGDATRGHGTKGQNSQIEIKMENWKQTEKLEEK